MATCVKKGCNNPHAIDKMLCEKHTEEWDEFRKFNGNGEWSTFIHDKKMAREKVSFT